MQSGKFRSVQKAAEQEENSTAKGSLYRASAPTGVKQQSEREC
jgi:hypothetical protein